jgi:levansucrase
VEKGVEMGANQPTGSRWTADAVARLRQDAATTIPPIDAATLAAARARALPGIDLWDMWPVQLADGASAPIGGGTLWMILSAPALPDSDQRHGIARIRLVLERDGAWIDCCDVLPDGLCPGSREWAGSAMLDPNDNTVTLYFTAAGHRCEPSPSFAQRLFETVGTLIGEGDGIRIIGWSDPVESLVADGQRYMIVDQATGVPGFIKGFRDPAYFRDPADGAEYLLFTASLPDALSDWNGAVGVARREDGAWAALDPLLRVDGLNNELERPHIVARDGRYYLFFSTQRRVFAPGGPDGPNGLYGMVAEHVLGPYRPINGSGLVAANPPHAPYQTYSWWVTGELEVAGFVEMPGLTSDPANETAEVRRAHFGGVPAPRFRIALDGDRAWVIG